MIQLAINFFIVLGFISVGYLLGTARSSRRINGLIEYNNQKVQECRVLQVRCTQYKVMLNGTYGVRAAVPSYHPFYDPNAAPAVIQTAEGIKAMNDMYAKVQKCDGSCNHD